MNVDLPSEDPSDENGNISLPGGGKVNLFRLTSEFATIESRVYKELYSRKAAKQSENELIYTISELDYLLEEWKESIPIEFQPEYDIDIPDAGLILHVLVLHFSYYNTLIARHTSNLRTSRILDHQILERVPGGHGHSGPAAEPKDIFLSLSLCHGCSRINYIYQAHPVRRVRIYMVSTSLLIHLIVLIN